MKDERDTKYDTIEKEALPYGTKIHAYKSKWLPQGAIRELIFFGVDFRKEEL